MDVIVKTVNGYISQLQDMGVLTVKNLVYAMIIGILLVIIPVKIVRRLGAYVLTLAPIIALLVWLFKLAELL